MTIPPTEMENKNNIENSEEEEILNKIERSLCSLSQSLLELGISASDVPEVDESESGSNEGQTSSVVSRKVGESIQHLSEINEYKSQTQTRIPLEIIDYVDQGKNPNLYTKEFTEQVALENMYMNGKLTSMKTYEDMLATAISENFPELSSDIEQKRKH